MKIVNWRAVVSPEGMRFIVKLSGVLECPFCKKTFDFNCRPCDTHHSETMLLFLFERLTHILQEPKTCSCCRKVSILATDEVERVLREVETQITPEWVEKQIEAMRTAYKPK